MVAAALCALCVPGLVLVAVVVDLDTADRVASLAGAATGLVGLALSVLALRRPGAPTVLARGNGAISVGGNVSHSAVGPNSEVTGRAAAPTAGAAAAGSVVAEGDGAFAAGGDVTGSALGDGSEVDGR
ncbi:hypothetical protein AVL59_16065 [Streptomyces griseochromogenes]|uniref:Uncharacterized protein n=1 Tax=Streptomyces griseochromogenes TaxID=68214 RepID=A0A1B1AWG9_9ACTN|nr:hypothetical protein AVL59_16065 [Streptomyces griseochromogenes]